MGTHCYLDTKLLRFLPTMSTLVTSLLLLLAMLVHNQASPLPGQDDDDDVYWNDEICSEYWTYYYVMPEECKTRKKREDVDSLPIKTKRDDEVPVAEGNDDYEHIEEKDMNYSYCDPMYEVMPEDCKTRKKREDVDSLPIKTKRDDEVPVAGGNDDYEHIEEKDMN